MYFFGLRAQVYSKILRKGLFRHVRGGLGAPQKKSAMGEGGEVRDFGAISFVGDPP